MFDILRMQCNDSLQASQIYYYWLFRVHCDITLGARLCVHAYLCIIAKCMVIYTSKIQRDCKTFTFLLKKIVQVIKSALKQLQKQYQCLCSGNSSTILSLAQQKTGHLSQLLATSSWSPPFIYIIFFTPFLSDSLVLYTGRIWEALLWMRAPRRQNSWPKSPALSHTYLDHFN